jgi:hypothetical protein
MTPDVRFAPGPGLVVAAAWFVALLGADDRLLAGQLGVLAHHPIGELDEIVEVLATRRLVDLPPFTVMAVDGADLEVLVRGDIDVHVEGGEELELRSPHTRAWLERRVPDWSTARAFLVGEAPPDPGEHWLSAGVAPATTIWWSSSEHRPADQPATAVTVSALCAGDVAPAVDPAPAGDPVDAADRTPQAANDGNGSAHPPADYDQLFAKSRALTVEGAAKRSAEPTDEHPPASTSATATVVTRKVLPAFSTDPHGLAPSPSPAGQRTAPPPTGARSPGYIEGAPAGRAPAPPPRRASGDHDGMTRSLGDGSDVLNPDTRPPDSTGLPDRTGMVAASRCAGGHLNPPYVAVCRVCDAPAITAEPVEMVTTPVVGVLVLPSGERVDVDRTVLIGRAPRPDGRYAGEPPRLVALASPDLSRTHVELCPSGWTVTVRDSGSTNGTVLQLPEREPERIRGDEAITIVPGSTLVLGGTETFRFEVE